MIKINTDNGEIEYSGTIPIITSEVLSIIHIMYNKFKENDEHAAEFFKDAMTRHLQDAFISNEEAKEKFEENKKKAIKELDALKSLLDILQSTMNDDDDEKKDDPSKPLDISNPDDNFKSWLRGLDD